ncbi:hypothetical protein ABE10_00540, partial [Bacillus toyonensis]|nr:hypothetical protein [Bacillus toyonensis]
DHRRGVEESPENEAGRPLQIRVQDGERGDQQPETHEQHHLQGDGHREAQQPPAHLGAAEDGEQDEDGQRAEEFDPLAQDDPGDPGRPRDRRRPDQPRVLAEGAGEVADRGVEPDPREQRRDEEDDVRLLPHLAMEHLGEDEPVDHAHHERVEHRPEVAEEARRIADAEVTGGEQPQGVDVPPRAPRRADRCSAHRLSCVPVLRRSACPRPAVTSPSPRR